MSEILIALLAIAGVVAIAIPISLWFAFSAIHLWAWFVVPVFNVPTLTMLQMWGICLTLSVMRPKTFFSKSDSDKDWQGSLTGIILGPPLSLALGYAIKFWWMP